MPRDTKPEWVEGQNDCRELEQQWQDAGSDKSPRADVRILMACHKHADHRQQVVETTPEMLREPTPEEILSAKVAAANRSSRERVQITLRSGPLTDNDVPPGEEAVPMSWLETAEGRQPDDDQEQHIVGEALPDAWALVYHSGYSRHSGPFSAALWGCGL